MSDSSEFSPDLVLPRIAVTSRDQALETVATALATLDRHVTSVQLYDELRQREEIGSTGIGDGVAIPHCKIKGLKKPLVGLATIEKPVDFFASDGKPVKLMVVLVSPKKAPADHLRLLAQVSKWLLDADRVKQLGSLVSEEEIRAQV